MTVLSGRSAAGRVLPGRAAPCRRLPPASPPEPPAATGDDDVVFGHMAAALRPGGVLALSAFSSYFVVKYFDSAVFDAATGVNHEHTEVRSETGEAKTVDLWTGCYTPRELRLLCRTAGLEPVSISSVEPGRYGTEAPTVETAEFLLVARRA